MKVKKYAFKFIALRRSHENTNKKQNKKIPKNKKTSKNKQTKNNQKKK